MDCLHLHSTPRKSSEDEELIDITLDSDTYLMSSDSTLGVDLTLNDSSYISSASCPMLDATLDTTIESVLEVTVQPSSNATCKISATFSTINSTINPLQTSCVCNNTLTSLSISATPTNAKLNTPTNPRSSSADTTLDPLFISPNCDPLSNSEDHGFTSTCNTTLNSTLIMKAKTAERWDMLSIFEVKGCSEEPCALAVHQLTPGDVVFYHDNYSKRDQLQQRQWLFEFLSSNCSREEKVFNFVVCGKSVCQDIWLQVLGITPSKFSKVKAEFLRGRVSAEKPTLLRKPKLSTCEAIGWMGNYFERVGDHMPDKIAIHLPSMMSRKSVYERMKQERSDYVSLVSQSQFYSLWKQHYPHVSIPTENRFTKCDTCCMLKDEKDKTTDSKRKVQLRQMLDDHLALQAQERKYYYHHRDLGQRQKRECLSVIIDGMDQSKTNLPHLIRERKAGSNLWRLRTHVTAAIVHGQGTYTYIDVHSWPHDSNLTINILLDILMKQAFLPPVLYLQLDNTARENKNQYILSFLSYLVHMKIFSEIHLSFLMVGHTHEDVDQVFSRISAYLRRNSVYTLSDLELAIVNSDRDIRSATVLKRALDVKGWLKPHIDTPTNHTNPHNFLFRLDEQQQCVMQYRNWSSDAWMAGVKLLGSIPEGSPSFMAADFSKLDLPKLMADAAKYPNAGVPIERMEFWSNLESSLHELHQMPDGDVAEQWLSELEAKKIMPEEDPAPPALSQQIMNACVKDRRPIPEIKTKSSLKTNRRQETPRQPAAKRRRTEPANALQPVDLTSSTVQEYQEGEIVALRCTKYNERPQLGQVLEVKENKVSIKWYDGTWSGKWKVYTYMDGRNSVAWVETLPVSDIIIGKIELTKSCSLPKATKDKLRDMYNSLDGPANTVTLQLTEMTPNSVQEYEEGEIVALRCVKYNERPQLGQVLEVKENKVSIKWYDGTWSGKWKVYTYMDGRNSVAWVETLPVSDIIIGKIELTKSCSLPKATKDKLRDLYNSLDNN